MTAIGTLAAGAVAGIWKIAAIGLLFALVTVGGWTGANWWLAARDRDAARVELVAERKVSEDLRTAIREQNLAIQAMADAKKAAEARGKVAEQLATANGKRFDLVLSQRRADAAVTCPEAMPTVDAVWEAVR